MAYATLAELKAVLNITGTGSDTELSVWLDAASRFIDDYCGRTFGVSEVGVWIYRADYAGRLRIEDASAITLVESSRDRTTWRDITADVILWPYNGPPYTGIDLSLSPWAIPTWLRITGTFGYATVPETVKAACLRMAGALYRQAEAGFSEAIATGELGTVTITRATDRTTLMMLTPYRRLVLA